MMSSSSRWGASSTVPAQTPRFATLPRQSSLRATLLTPSSPHAATRPSSPALWPWVPACVLPWQHSRGTDPQAQEDSAGCRSLQRLQDHQGRRGRQGPAADSVPEEAFIEEDRSDAEAAEKDTQMPPI